MTGKMCMAYLLLLTPSVSLADDWPQWRGPQRDGVWRESGIIQRFQSSAIEPVWRMPISSGYSGPTVANGRVYVTDRVVEPKQIERIHCLDARTGKVLWMHQYDCEYRDIGYDAGPRASVTVYDKLAYALGGTGILHCLNANSGEVVWKKDLGELYKIRMPIWGISSAPLIDKDMVILQIGGEDGACLVALDRRTGQERWRSLEDNASYATPIIVDHEGLRLLICYTGEHVVGLNPEDGVPYWKFPFPPTKMIIGISDPVVHRGHVFLTNFFDGSLLLKLEDGGRSVRKIWKRAGPSEKETESLHSIISTPIIDGEHIYGVDSYGELRCLEFFTGDRVWEDLTAVPKARWATIHMVRHGDNVWMFNERGELIISRLSAKGFEEISRAKLIEPTLDQLRRRGGVCWSHPAFAGRHVFARNDKEIVCASLASP
ncbi:MAG: PQQ-binding-like beta-propeller repeat protein [Planctomycetota bacterium]